MNKTTDSTRSPLTHDIEMALAKQGISLPNKSEIPDPGALIAADSATKKHLTSKWTNPTRPNKEVSKAKRLIVKHSRKINRKKRRK